MFRRSSVAAVVMAGMFVSSGSGVMAEEGTVQLKEVVVTATKTEKQLQDVTQSVTVITADEIKKSGATTIPEVVNTTAGVKVNDQGPLGALRSVTIRGSSYQQVLILLDGQRLNSASAGGYDLSNLPIPVTAIERIEIVRGPSSALYGADAVGGVINIITKKPTTDSTTLSGALGGQGYTSGTLYNAGRENNTYYTVSLSKERSHGYRDNSDTDQKIAGVKLGNDLSATSSLEATFDYITKDIGVPGSVLFPSPLARQQTREDVAGLAYRKKFSPDLDFSLRVYRNEEKINYENPDFLVYSKNKGVTSAAETQVNWLLGSYSLLTLGAEGQESSFQSGDPAVGLHRANLSAEFIQDEINFGDSLIVIVGGRNDSHSVYGDKWSPRASARYLETGTGAILRASAGKSFRAPTLNDLYFHDGFGNDGNAGLKPENAEEYEGGIEQPLGRGSAIKFTAFKRRVRDLILWLPNPASPFYPFAYTPINTDGIVRITGTETELRFVLSRMLSGTLNYTRIFPVKLDTGERLFSAATNIPAMKFGGTLNLALDARTALSLDGQRVKNYVGPGEEKWDYYTVDGRVTDAIVSRKDLKMDVFVGMKNMFNRKYEVVKDYPMPPTQLYGGVTAQF